MTEPSLAVVNARVWTGDAARPWAEALVVDGERVAQVGSSAEARKRIGAATRVVDARGMLVTPGFIDAHVHFLQGGFGLASLQLRDADTPQEFSRRIAERAAGTPRGRWILHGDWDHERWGGELPRRDWIDAATPDHPVWVNRLDSHMSLANGAALRAAGITRDTPDVDGGTIVRDAGGEPTGLFKDNARQLVDRAVLAPDSAEEDAALDAAMRYVAANGVTAVHHMGTWEDLAVFERAHHGQRLATRIYAAVPLSSWERLRDRIAASGRGDAWLRIGALKGFVDGSLGSRAKHTYAIRSLPDAGARVAFGSDWPVAPATPLEGIYAAVTRRTLDGANPGGWHPEQRITVEQALRAYTSAAAFAGFAEAETGTLARGKLADFTIIDRDITRVAPESIVEARVMMAVVGGRIVYERS
jgi:hypothetical protein